ncbi:MAG: type II toxin-antitoxin system HicA family toxin [Massilia sp.]
MTKFRKALARLSATPPPSDLKWEALKTVLEHMGYVLTKGAGSRRKFYHEAYRDLII